MVLVRPTHTKRCMCPGALFVVKVRQFLLLHHLRWRLIFRSNQYRCVLLANREFYFAVEEEVVKSEEAAIGEQVVAGAGIQVSQI